MYCDDKHYSTFEHIDVVLVAIHCFVKHRFLLSQYRHWKELYRINIAPQTIFTCPHGIIYHMLLAGTGVVLTLMRDVGHLISIKRMSKHAFQWVSGRKICIQCTHSKVFTLRHIQYNNPWINNGKEYNPVLLNTWMYVIF